MQPDTVKELLNLNHQFYQTFATQFSATRQRIQPGVRRLSEAITHSGRGENLGLRLLDLGCGNGELWRFLQHNTQIEHYTGIDFSPPLLDFAGEPETKRATFIQADLSASDWSKALEQEAFDYIFAFAVLHHLPGSVLRQQVLHQIRHLLAPGGSFYHSEWQFLNSPRLKARIQPWELAGLSTNQVDSGDYLLDWRQGGTGLRYVHHFELDELEQLAHKSGFHIVETFFSDGEGGKLGLYQVWESSAK